MTTLLHARAREHSRKPEKFYRLVESLCPGTKVRLFARTPRIGGWCGELAPWACNPCRGWRSLGDTAAGPRMVRSAFFQIKVVDPATAEGFTFRASRWHHVLSMVTRRTQQAAKVQSQRVDRATFRASDYGRVIQADGTDRWWVRSSNGAWMALSHQRVVENDDGTITLLYLN